MERERKTPYEAVSEQRAQELWRDSPEDALAGTRSHSAETYVDGDRLSAVTMLVEDEPERFLELVGYLPHLIQDIILQYYLLGRTQTQIGVTVGYTQMPVGWYIRLGLRAMCAVIYFGGVPTRAPKDAREREMLDAWDAMVNFKTDGEKREELCVETAANLGDFEITTTDVNLMEFFAPNANPTR